jgi:minor histocompatibility antigen H13
MDKLVAHVVFLDRWRWQCVEGESPRHSIVAFVIELRVSQSAASVTRFAVGEVRWKKFDRNRVLILKGPRGSCFHTMLYSWIWVDQRVELLSVTLRTPTIALFPLALIPSVLFNTSETSRKSALITDILGLSFSYNAICLLKIDSFKTGCILLSGLFFYDIYWVFGTDVVSVCE